MKIFNSTLNRSSALLVIGLFIALLGVKAFLAMPRSLFPQVNYPRVKVEVNMGYTPLETMEWSVTSILERELRAVPGVRLVKSVSSRGLSTIDVYLNENQDVTQAVQLVNAKLGDARALIPAAAQVTVRPITAEAFPAAEYCFTSEKKDSRELRTFIEYTVRPLIMSIPGIYDSTVYGGDTPELSVNLDPKKLTLKNLTVQDVNDRIKNSNSVDFLGPIDSPDSEVLAFGGKFVKSPQEIEKIVVDSSLAQPVRVGDIGKVEIRNEWRTKSVSLDGKPCVALDVLYQSGIDQKQTSTQVLSTIQDIVKKNPGDAFRSWDLNDFTDAATNAVILDLAVGMVIIALVTLFFLRNLRYSLIALLSMPLAATFTFLAMSHIGLSINLMTLGGLTAAIGLVVDNTVIVLEMFHHRKALEPGKSKRELLFETLSSVARPMTFGTALIALVFTPISYLSGVSGMFFAPMAAVHGSSLTISVFLALLIVPGLILLLEPSDLKVKPPETSKKSFEDGRFAHAYKSVLLWSLRRSKIVCVAFLILPLLGALLLPLAKSGFLPEWDEGDMVIDYRSVHPMGIAAVENKIAPLENYLKKIPEVDFFVRKIGTGLGELNKAPNVGEIVVKLKTNRKRSVFEIRDQVSKDAPNLVKDFEFDLFQILPDRLNDLSGSAKPIVIYLRGKSSELDKAAAAYRQALSKVQGLDSVRIEEPDLAPELSFNLNETVTRALELNPTAVDESVRFGLFSLDSTSVQLGPQTVPIRLRSADQDPNSAPVMNKLAIFTTKGGLEKITTLGKITQNDSRIESSHINGTEVRTLTAELAGRDLGSVVKDILTVMNQTQVPGVFAELSGDYVMQQRSFKELLLAFGTGLALIFIVTLLFANRFTVAIPLTLCSTVPPVVGLVGCVLFQIPLDVSSFSGLISVTGIAVANSFMALAAIESDPYIHTDTGSSIIKGMLSRLRPILMTNLAAMAGFIPIAIGLAHGDEILRPFSIAIIVGLFGAIYTTLFLFPLFYSHFSRQLVEVEGAK